LALFLLGGMSGLLAAGLATRPVEPIPAGAAPTAPVRERWHRWVAPLLGLVLILLLAAFYGSYRQHERAEWATRLTSGDARHATTLLVRHGCAGCHDIPGVSAPRGTFGPPLQGLADRAALGGTVVNTPQNLVRWISRSREMDPHAGMPNTDAPEQDARDIAAYLYER